MSRTATSTPYDAIEIGQSATMVRSITEGDLRAFANLSGDTNPVHLDDDFAKGTPFKGRIVHGALMAAHISAALATEFPGPGTIYLEQHVRFRRPVRIGDTLTTHLEVVEKIDEKKFVKLKGDVTNQDGTLVATSESLVLAPTEAGEFELADRA